MSPQTGDKLMAIGFVIFLIVMFLAPEVLP